MHHEHADASQKVRSIASCRTCRICNHDAVVRRRRADGRVRRLHELDAAVQRIGSNVIGREGRHHERAAAVQKVRSVAGGRISRSCLHEEFAVCIGVEPQVSEAHVRSVVSRHRPPRGKGNESKGVRARVLRILGQNKTKEAR